jgi:hypothetical protein
MSRPAQRSATSAESTASAAGQASDAEEFESLFGPGFPDPLEEIATRAVPPPSMVDIGRAMAEGRRTRRRRAAGVTGTVGAGLAACCVAVLATGGNGTVRSDVADPALPIANTDPFTVGARFGWLPDGVEQDSSRLLRGALWLSAANTSSTGHGDGSETEFSLRPFPMGSSEQSALAAIASDAGVPPTAAASRVTARAQPPIDARPAYTVTDPMPIASNAREVTLLWQLGNGRWAELSEAVLAGTADSTGIDASALTAQARHVAETVTPDASGTALPFSIAGLPSGAVITSYSLGRQDASPSGWSTDIGIAVAGVTLYYNEGPVGEVLAATLGPTKCTTLDDLEACVTLTSGRLSDRFPAGGLQALADDIGLRGAARAGWTTDVFPDY